jgi:uncharacterized protein DUF3800
MYLLYLDESGNPDDASDKYFVIGGLAVFERQTFFLSQSMDALQAQHCPNVPPVEFHASPIRAGRGFWRGIDMATRQAILQDIGQIIAGANQPGVCLFAAVVEKSAAIYGEDAVKLATEQVCRRFDTFLARRATEHADPQRGLLVFAESHYQQRAKVWVRGFRELGTQWGVLRNLSDIPYFASTKESRLLQLADYVSHAMFMLYERRDPTLARGILLRIDQKNGILHGLAHAPHMTGRVCDCPACVSRRTPHDFGPWL